MGCQAWRRNGGFMGRSIVVIGLLVSLAACAPAPVRVEAEPPPLPEPPPVARPHLPIADLTPVDGADAVMRAYAATVEVLTGYAAELETLLDAYRDRRGDPSGL